MLKQLLLAKLQQIDEARAVALTAATQHANAGRTRLDVVHEVKTARLDTLNAQTWQMY